MNKRKAQELLIEYLTEYDREGFHFHFKFIEEMLTIVNKNAVGHENQLYQILVKQCSYVKTMGRMVHEADSNEILKEMKTEQEYYSLHIKDKVLNVRLLMTFDQNGSVFFLAAFFEKGGKKISDYSKWKNVIQRRYIQMKEELDHEK